MEKREHMVYGHFNGYVLDHEADCTGHGKHERVMACCPSGGELYCRVDYIWKLGEPSHNQILRAAKKQNGDCQRGKWVFDRVEHYDSGKSTDYYFKQVQP